MSPKSPENIPTVNTDKVEAKGRKLTDSKLLKRASAGALAIGLGLGVAGCADGEPAPTPSETVSTETPGQEPTETIEPTNEPSPTDLPTDIETTEPGDNGDHVPGVTELELTKEDIEIPSGLSVEEFSQKFLDSISLWYSQGASWESIKSDESYELGVDWIDKKVEEGASLFSEALFTPGYDSNSGIPSFIDSMMESNEATINWGFVNPQEAENGNPVPHGHFDSFEAEELSSGEGGRRVRIDSVRTGNTGEKAAVFYEFDTNISNGVETISSIYFKYRIL